MNAHILRVMALPLLGVVTAFTGLHAASQEETAATVVVYNTADPVGKELADFYCATREIDPAHEIGLTAPLSEEISRTDYERTIEGPLVEEFVKRGYWQFARGPSGKIRLVATQVSIVVLIKGMPLKVAPFTLPIPPTPPTAPSSSPLSPTSPQASPVAPPHNPTGPVPSTPTSPSSSPAPPAYTTCNAASVDSEPVSYTHLTLPTNREV